MWYNLGMYLSAIDVTRVLSEETAKDLRRLVRERGEKSVCAALRINVATLARCAACFSIQRATMSRVATWTRGERMR